MVISSLVNTGEATHSDEVEIPTDESIYSSDSGIGHPDGAVFISDATPDSLEELVVHFVCELARLKSENESLRKELERRFMGQAELVAKLSSVIRRLIDLPGVYRPSNSDRCFLQRVAILPELGNVASEGRLQIGCLVGAAYYPDKSFSDMENRMRERSAWISVRVY